MATDEVAEAVMEKAATALPALDVARAPTLASSDSAVERLGRNPRVYG